MNIDVPPRRLQQRNVKNVLKLQSDTSGRTTLDNTKRCVEKPCRKTQNLSLGFKHDDILLLVICPRHKY